MKMKVSLIWTALLFFFLMGCAPHDNNFSLDPLTEGGLVKSHSNEGVSEEIRAHQGDPLLIYTSIYPLYDFAVKIGGNRVVVNTIVPSGAEAHDFEPTPANVIDLHQADLLVYNGLGLETWLNKLVEAIDNPHLRIVDSSEHLPLTGEQNQGEKTDPHVWLDPLLAKQQAESILEALIEVDPDHAGYYKQNYEKLGHSLDALHAQFEAMSQKVKRRDFVVSHQAYGYLANRYGLNQVAIAGLSPSQEPGPKRMEEIIRFVRENGIRHILFENNVTRNVAQAIQSETGAEVLFLYNLESLSKEEMDQGHDYFSIMERNLEALKTALGQKQQ